MTTNERAPEGDRSYEAVRDRLSMPLVEAMETQRAVRKVLPDEVDDAIVLRCIELALKAPTGSNGQNWEFVVVKDRGIKKAFGDQYRRSWALYGRAGERMVAGNEEMAKVLRAVAWQVEHFEEIPVMVVPCLSGPQRFVPSNISKSSHYGSVYPSVQNLLLAARSMGLGASLITLPLWNTFYARKILGLPLTVQPVCMVPMGWPQGRYGPTTRKSVSEVTHLNKFGNRVFESPGSPDSMQSPSSPDGTAGSG